MRTEVDDLSWMGCQMDLVAGGYNCFGRAVMLNAVLGDNDKKLWSINMDLKGSLGHEMESGDSEELDMKADQRVGIVILMRVSATVDSEIVGTTNERSIAVNAGQIGGGGR